MDFNKVRFFKLVTVTNQNESNEETLTKYIAMSIKPIRYKI